MPLEPVAEAVEEGLVALFRTLERLEEAPEALEDKELWALEAKDDREDAAEDATEEREDKSEEIALPDAETRHQDG